MNLPDYYPINIRNEIDRYGFSYLLANKLNIKIPPKSHALWPHGWKWNKEFEYIENFSYTKQNSFIPTIVANKRIKKSIEKFGFNNVILGGLPYAYVEQQNKIRIKNSLLIILPHSLSHYNYNFKIDQLLEIISVYKKDFTKVSCCIYFDDYGNDLLINKIKKLKLNIISGARQDDRNSLIRMRYIFDSFEYVASPVMGSHILYSLYSGCKTSLIEPIYEYSKDFYLNDPFIKKNIFILEDILKFQSLKYLKNNYIDLFCDHPINAKKNLEWVDYEIGTNNLINLSNITELLGWNLRGKINYLIKKYTN